MIKFQYYNNDAKSPEPMGYVSLMAFLKSIKTPKPDTKKLLDDISKAAIDGDKELKSTLKTKLYSFTPCVHVKSRRAYSDITNFTGLTVLDFDKIDNADGFKHFLFNMYGSIIAAWLSPSRRGVKALVKIPIVKTVDEYKRYFFGLASEMEIYKGFDDTTQNAVLPLFIGWDEDILTRTDYTTWNIKGSKKGSFSSSPAPVPVYASNKRTEWVVNWYRNKINTISDNGHPQLRDNSVTLGGYVASGYIDINDAINLANNLVESNGYLQKGVSGYKKTVLQAIHLGMTKPLTFDN